jgi:cysteine dioxygenase
MASVIDRAFAALDRFDRQLPLSTIMDWFGQEVLALQDLSSYLSYSPERYVRNRVRTGPAYQALVLCWRNGQRSPIHNHRGSHCGVKVLAGIATETLFARAPNGLVYPVASRDLPLGHTCASADDDIHQMSNLQAGGADLVTLHIYSPPLLRMEVFSLDIPAVREWDDPVNDPFAQGGGI